jgi:hypothetical protein
MAITKTIPVVDSILKYLSRTSPFMLAVHLIYISIASMFLSSAYVVSFHWDSLIRIYEEAHSIQSFSANLKTSVENDNRIYTDLNVVLADTKGMRASVYRYHNGLAAISGVPFFFQTMTHEVIAPGASRIMGFEQRIPAGIHMKINNEFIQNKCAIINNTDKDPSNQDYYFYQSRNAKALIRCPIYMDNGDLFGFVGVDFSKDLSAVTADSTVKDVETIKRAADSIGKLFASTAK